MNSCPPQTVLEQFTAKELANDLHRWMNREPIRARPVSMAERLRSWCRRNPAIASMTAVILFAVVVGITGVTWQWLRAERKADESRIRLVQQYVSNGVDLMEDGDLTGSLVWFVEALKHDGANPTPHNTRLSTVLRHCPRLTQVFFTEDKAVVSPDGRRMLLIDGAIASVRSIATVESHSVRLRHSGFVKGAWFAHNGQSVMTATEVDESGSRSVQVQIWDAGTGTQQGATIQLEDLPQCLALSFDGSRLVTGEDKIARLWNSESGLQVGEPMHHRFDLTDVKFGPDDRLIVAVSGGVGDEGWEGEVCLWDATTGTAVTPPLRHDDWVYSLAFSSDGKRLITGSMDMTARVWDIESGEPLTPPLRHSDEVHTTLFAPDGRSVVTAGEDGTIRLWDIQRKMPTNEHSIREQVTCVSFSHDGRRCVAAGASERACVWDLRDSEPNKVEVRHEDIIYAASFDATGTRIVTASGDRSSLQSQRGGHSSLLQS